MNILKISSESLRNQDQQDNNGEHESNESYHSLDSQTQACREEDEDINNSTSRFDSDCIFQAMQDGMTGRRTEQEEFYNFSEKKDTKKNADYDNENYLNHINILNQENIMLRQRNNQLINEIEITRQEMESNIEQLKQKAEQVLINQKQTYEQSLETLKQQHCMQIQAHQAVIEQLQNKISQLQNEVAVLKKDKETIEKMYDVKKIIQGYGNGLAKKTSLPDALEYLQGNCNIEQFQNSKNTTCTKNSSFSQHLAEIREKQYEVLRENTQINNQNHNNNYSTNKPMLKGSFGKLALLAHLGSESVDLSNKQSKQLSNNGITTKQQKEFNSNTENIFLEVPQMPSSQAQDRGATIASLNWQDNSFKLQRLSQQFSKEKLTKHNSNVNSNPFSFELEVPAPANIAPYNSCNLLEADEQQGQLLSSKFSGIFQTKEDELHNSSNSIFSALSATFNNEGLKQLQKEQQISQQQRSNINIDHNKDNNLSLRYPQQGDSSLSRVKDYGNSLMLIQRACSLGPSRKNSCLEEDYHKFVSLNSYQRINNHEIPSITNNKSKSNQKNHLNDNLRFRSNSFAVPNNHLIPSQSLRESKYLVKNQSYMKQTQSSKSKQATGRSTNQLSPEKKEKYTNNQCKYSLNSSNHLSKKIMLASNTSFS